MKIICTQLYSFKYSNQILMILKRSILHIDGILTGTTTPPGLSGPGSNGNKGMIPNSLEE